MIYSLTEPEAYHNDKVLIVGGGDRAMEAALALSDQPGNQVTISYRGDGVGPRHNTSPARRKTWPGTGMPLATSSLGIG